MIKVGIVGGTGYTGVELLRLLAMHPEARVQAITSRSEAGVPVGTMFPSLRGLGQLSALQFSEPLRQGRRPARRQHAAFDEPQLAAARVDHAVSGRV